MDAVYHAGVGVAIARGMGVPQYALPAAIFSMLPDIVGITPYYYFILKQKLPGSIYRAIRTNSFAGPIDRTVYRTTHSIFTVLLIGCTTFLIDRSVWGVLMLAYASHIMIDILSHDGEFATRIFYPFSDFHFSGKNWTQHSGVFLLFWLALIGILRWFSPTR